MQILDIIKSNIQEQIMLLDIRFNTDFITDNINILIFDFGKWQKHWYSEAVGKRCSEKVANLKKPALQMLRICGQILEKKTFILQAFIFLIVFKAGT